MSTATTVWVPLVTAGVGLIAGIGAAMGTAVLTQRRTDRREDVRWQREREDRQEQWQRERKDRQEQWQREDSLRWLQHRQAAYARLTTALFQWDAELRSAGECRQADAPVGERTRVDWTEMDRRERDTREALDSVLFLAPGDVGALARTVIRRRQIFRSSCLVPQEVAPADLDKGLAELVESRRSLRDALRNDVELEVFYIKTGKGDAAEKGGGRQGSEPRL